MNVLGGNLLPPASVMARCASGYMLENPAVSRTTRVVRTDIYSDKVTGAENQQERLIEFRGWVIGFVRRRRVLLNRVRAATKPPGPKRLQNRFPGFSRVRRDARCRRHR